MKEDRCTIQKNNKNPLQKELLEGSSQEIKNGAPFEDSYKIP